MVPCCRQNDRRRVLLRQGHLSPVRAGWCDTCLADQVKEATNVEMKVQQIAEAACTLVESNGFRRTLGKCSACKQMKTITGKGDSPQRDKGWS